MCIVAVWIKFSRMKRCQLFLAFATVCVIEFTHLMFHGMKRNSDLRISHSVFKCACPGSKLCVTHWTVAHLLDSMMLGVLFRSFQRVNIWRSWGCQMYLIWTFCVYGSRYVFFAACRWFLYISSHWNMNNCWNVRIESVFSPNLIWSSYLLQWLGDQTWPIPRPTPKDIQNL